MIGPARVGSKELEGNTPDELAQQVAQDYQYFVASGDRLAKAIFDPEYQQRFSALTKSIQIEVLDFVTDDQKSTLQKLVMQKVQQGPYPGLDREVEIAFHFSMPIGGPIQ